MVKLAQLIWRRCEMVTWFAENVSKCFQRIWPNWKLDKVWSGHRNIRNIQEYVDVGQNLKGKVLALRENLDLNIIYWSVINAASADHRCRIGWRTFGCKCKVGKSDHQEGVAKKKGWVQNWHQPTWSFYQMNIAKALTVRWSRRVYLKLKKCQAAHRKP